MAVTPIFIPMGSSSSEPERCPNCNELENKVTLCKHCGYEYKDDPGGFWEWVMIIGGVLLALIAVIWIIITCGQWLAEGEPLFGVLHDQWKWLRSIRIY